MFHHLLPTHLVLPIIYYLDCVFQAFRYASQQKSWKKPKWTGRCCTTIFGGLSILGASSHWILIIFSSSLARKVVGDIRLIRKEKSLHKTFWKWIDGSWGTQNWHGDFLVCLSVRSRFPPSWRPKIVWMARFLSLSIPTTTTPGYQKWPAIINWEIASLFWLFQATWIYEYYDYKIK